MSFVPAKALVFGMIALPVGFILVAFTLAAMNLPIEAPRMLPWAGALAVASALIGGLTKGAK